MLINFSQKSSKSWTFFIIILVIWSIVAMNCFIVFHYPKPSINENEVKKFVFQSRHNNQSSFINLQILNQFLEHFAQWVPKAVRVHKIEMTSEFIKVYGKTENAQVFSNFWENFKHQHWVQRLNLLQWEIQTTAQWLFAFQVGF